MQGAAGETLTGSVTGNSTSESQIPSYSSWFEFGKVHDIERRSLPEFFESEKASETVSKDVVDVEGMAADAVQGGLLIKSPATYVEYRDFMVKTFRTRPHEPLTVTSCRRHLSGDVGSLVRIHSFLEQWGLINNGVLTVASASKKRAVQLPHARTAPPKSALAAAVAVSMAQVNFQDLYSTSNSSFEEKAVCCVNCSNPCVKDRCFLLMVSPYSSTEDSMQQSSCSVSESEKTAVNRHLDSTSRQFLCGVCYENGRFLKSTNAKDYSLVSDQREWTEEETLALLTVVEELSETKQNRRDEEGAIDWEMVSSRMITNRTAQDCLVRFLSLPITEAATASAASDVKSDLMAGDLKVSALAIPFTTGENPVMATLAFLAKAVHPRVATAAAAAAISEAATVSRCDSSMDQDSDKFNKEVDGKDTASVDRIGGTALGCAAKMASEVANDEEKRVHLLKSRLVDLQLQKIKVKMNMYEELERSLEEDRKELEQQRLQLFFDRFNLRKQITSIEEQTQQILADASVVVGTVAADQSSSTSQSINIKEEQSDISKDKKTVRL